MSFEILHISDVHFANEPTSQMAFRDKIIKEIQEKKLGADCLVISGDLFHRGALEQHAAQASMDFISKLKTSLKKQIAFGGQMKWVEPIILACPGNHDLNRDASRRKNGAYNGFIKRADIVSKAGEILKNTDGEYHIDSNEAVVLYQESFDAFQQFSEDIGSKTFCTPNNPKAEGYEVQQKVLQLPENQCAIQLVFLNTALFAGQTVYYDGFRARKNNLEQEYRQLVEGGNTVKAAQIFLKISKLQESYEKCGGIVIDEEENTKLGLSVDGNAHLGNIESQYGNPCKNTICTIFIGHHGVEFLSAETRKALEAAMKRCKSGIYLCGHAHEVRYTEHQLAGVTDPRRIEQIQAGVMFADNEGYAQYGFNHIKIDVDEAETMLNVFSHYLVKTPFGDCLWGDAKIVSHRMNGCSVESREDSLTGELKFDPVPEKNAVDPEMELNIPDELQGKQKKAIEKSRSKLLQEAIDFSSKK